MTALLDTGFLLAVIDADDSLHTACTAALEAEPAPLLPDVVLPELAYLILRELGPGAYNPLEISRNRRVGSGEVHAPGSRACCGGVGKVCR
jgi:predicted nucleic acid-binding protein